MEIEEHDVFSDMSERDLIDVIESMTYLMPANVEGIENFKKLRNISLKLRKSLLSDSWNIATKKKQISDYLKLINENKPFKEFTYTAYIKFIHMYRLKFVVNNYEEYNILSTSCSQSQYLNGCIKKYLSEYEKSIILNFSDRDHILKHVEEKYRNHIRSILMKPREMKCKVNY